LTQELQLIEQGIREKEKELKLVCIMVCSIFEFHIRVINFIKEKTWKGILNKN
jgi:hypothetical protein